MAEDALTRTMAASGQFNAESMVITAAVATNTPVVRRDRQGSFQEILSPDGFRLQSEDVALLDSHNQRSARATLGRAFNFRRDGDAVLADLRFSGADDVVPVVQRVRDGTLSAFSIGYHVHRWADANGPNGRTRTAVEWTINEVSLVSIPADINARRRGSNMEDELETPEVTPAQNRATIRQIGRAANMTTEAIDDMIDRDLTITEARAEAFEAMQARGRQTIRVHAPANDDPNMRLRAMEDALFARISGGNPSDAARPFVGHTLRDFAREALTLRGHSSAGMDADQLFRAAMHTTSDFPNLLQGVGRRTLLASYTAAASALKPLARQGSRTDFRAGSTLRLGELGALQKVNEAGEIKSVSRAETASSYAIDTYGALFSISRKALINDDLGAFNDWAFAAGQAASQTEAALLWGLLSQSSGAGPLMSDGKRLFHADHGNLMTGAALSEDSLSDARLALRKQKGTDGKTTISVTPKTLLVGPELETKAEKLLTTINATTTDDVNPFGGKLLLAVEPRITDDSWYVFADPATVPVLEYSYLSSAPGPQMSSREGWEVLSVEYRVYLDFGAGAIDWRGVVRNPGV
jgi:HK97 family phage prohead protease